MSAGKGNVVGVRQDSDAGGDWDGLDDLEKIQEEHALAKQKELERRAAEFNEFADEFNAFIEQNKAKREADELTGGDWVEVVDGLNGWKKAIHEAKDRDAAIEAAGEWDASTPEQKSRAAVEHVKDSVPENALSLAEKMLGLLTPQDVAMAVFWRTTALKEDVSRLVDYSQGNASHIGYVENRVGDFETRMAGLEGFVGEMIKREGNLAELLYDTLTRVSRLEMAQQAAQQAQAPQPAGWQTHVARAEMSRGGSDRASAATPLYSGIANTGNTIRR